MVLFVRVDIEKLNTGAKMVHELAQGSRRDRPAIGRYALVKLGMCGCFGLKG